MEILKYLLFAPIICFGQIIKKQQPLVIIPYQNNVLTLERTVIDEDGNVFYYNRFGVRSNFPIKKIEENGDVYEVNRFGVRANLPTAKIEINEIQNETPTRVYTTRNRTVRREFGRRQE